VSPVLHRILSSFLHECILHLNQSKWKPELLLTEDEL